MAGSRSADTLVAPSLLNDVDVSSAPVRATWATQGLAASLGLWAVGVQVHELFATIGLAFTLIFAVVVAWSERASWTWKAVLSDWGWLAAFVAWALLGPLLANHTPNPDGLGRLFDWCALPAAVYGFGRLSGTQRKRILGAAAITLVVGSVVAGLQHFGLWPSPSFFSPLKSFGIPVERMYENVEGSTTRFMAGGLLFHRLKFAHVSGLVVVCLAVASLDAQGREKWLARASAGAGFAAILMFTQARAAAVAIVFSTLVWVAVRGRLRFSKSMVWVALAVAAGVALTPGLSRRFLDASVSPSSTRGQLNQAGLVAIGREPITGSGLWQFRVKENVVRWDVYPWVYDHPGRSHNQFITMGAELGLVGLGLFLMMMIQLARRAARAGQAALASGLLGYFGLLSLFHDPLFHAEMSMAVVLALAVMVVPKAVEVRRRRQRA